MMRRLRLPALRSGKAIALPCLAFLALSVPGISAPKPVLPNPGGKPGAGKSAPAALDTARIRALYVEGEFDEASRMLEAGFHEGRLRSHADSVFAFKHLGVMYSAQAETRERGKYHLVQLLMIEPGARILDMYASDMIYMIFRNLQDEVAAQARNRHPRDTAIHAPRQADRRGAQPSGSSSPLKIAAWIGGATLAVGVGVVTYLVLEGNSGENFPVD